MSIGTFSSLGKGGTSPQQASDQRTVRGSIARAPSSGDESLFVVVPGFSLALPYEVISARWEHASNLPAAGASCLIVFDDDGDAWCPLWEGMIPGGASSDTNTILHGAAPPSDDVGESGDFYIDDDDWLIYGPKNGSWPEGASMVGPIGPTGASGATGAAGPKGDKGDTGAVGPAGSQGPQGTTGAQGPTGPTGATGPKGADSTVPGPTGATGPTGPKGADSTVPGPAGPTGAPGPTGATGPQGSTGPAGVSYEASPVGAVLTFPGKNLPVGYVVADGKSYAQGTYPQGYAFAAAEVAAGNPLWSVNASAQTFTVPDLRDRFLYSSASLAFAANGGEVNHTLVNGEMPVHSHSGATTGGTSGTDSPDHAHVLQPDTAFYNTAYGASGTLSVATGGSGLSFPRQSGLGSAGANVRHAHAIPALGIYNDGGGATHNNMPPYVVLAFIVKVWGVINNGATLVGPPGARGNTTYLYNGAGTPPAGTFVGEIDGDWAVRKSDGENFQRQAGAWVDLGFTNRTTAATASARGYRNAALSVPTGIWTKVALDAKTFDVSSNLYDAANGRFVAPTAGVYRVSGFVTYSVSATGTYTYTATAIWKNGAVWTDPQNLPAVQSYFLAPVSDDMQLNAGDYVELYAYLNYQAGSVVTGPSQTYMSVTLLTAGPGPQGVRGSNWFTYVGAGTPAAGTFLNEADGDMATRGSDGEVFRRISGAWSDQGWKVATGQNAMDTWHLVGNAGEPAFQGGWVNYGAGFLSCGFRKFPDGRVKLKGLVLNGTGTVFTLPIGYRPPGQYLGPIESNPNVNSRIDITTAGAVSITLGSGGNNGFVSLDGVEFDTETVSVMSAGAMGPPGPGSGAYSVQRTWNGYPGASNESYTPTFTTTQIPLSLSITPSVPVWWEVKGKLGLVTKVDANYNYAIAMLVLNPVDQDGIGATDHYITQHSAVQNLEGYEGHRLFRLAAGTTYTVTLQLVPSGGSWNYYQGRSQTYMDAKAWAQ